MHSFHKIRGRIVGLMDFCQKRNRLLKGATDRPTDRVTLRDARTHLKRLFGKKMYYEEEALFMFLAKLCL